MTSDPSTSKPTRPPYEVKVAETRDEVEACFDIRVEGESAFFRLSVAVGNVADHAVFHVEQGFSLDDEIDQWEKEAVHILLTTPVDSPPDVATSFLTPWLANLSEAVSSLLPDAMSQSKTDHSEHDGVSISQKPIGTIRYVPSTGKLSRLAILKEYRQYGFGRVLVDELEQAAITAARSGRAQVTEGKVTIKSHSQIYVIPFYEKLGYVQEGERFDEDGAPHQKLVKRIAV